VAWCVYSISAPISPEHTMDIAQSEFRSMATSLGATADDFIAPEISDIGLKDRLTALEWPHKMNEKCVLSVYVDRRYATANSSASSECSPKPIHP
jgi:hypothetical protein